MKKHNIIYHILTGLILTAILTTLFTTFAGCKGEENAAVVYSTTPAGPKFNYPSGIVALTSAIGVDLYVADTTNHTIRKIAINTTSGTVDVDTVAGKAGTPGYKDDTGDLARFRYPRGITTDGTNLYVADSNNHTIRQVVIDTWVVTTLAGVPGTSGSADTDPITGVETFNKPYGIAHFAGKLYVADTLNNLIRQVDVVTGNTIKIDTGTAVFNKPIGVATDDGIIIYVSDTDDHTIKTINTSTNSVSLLAGISGTLGHDDKSSPSENATFYKPAGLALSGTKLFVADQYNQLVREVDVTNGNVTTLAGKPEFFYKSQDQVSDRFKFPQGVATLLDGTTLYIADTFGHALRRLVSGNPLEVLEGDPLFAGNADD
jgi:sugar lactone lactonase YvrE